MIQTFTQLIPALLNTAFLALGGYLLLNCAYLLFFALAGLRRSVPLAGPVAGFQRCCVLIPAYREDGVIIQTARAALRHRYGGHFDVFVVADGLKPATLQALKSAGAGVIKVHFERSTKGKALRFALAALPPGAYDAAVVLDADNLMGAGFLDAVNVAFGHGYRVVQGHRTAKNTDTPFALLDACNEEINNTLFRKGHQAAGLSPNLIGSGMAFSFAYLQTLLADIGEATGEDKEMDFRIARDGVKVRYLHGAYVYDEKVANAKVFAGQRSRWIRAQLSCARKYFFEGFGRLFRHGNLDFFEKTMQTLLVPRVLLLGLLTGLLGQSLLHPYGLSPAFWAALLGTAGVSLLIALPRRFYGAGLWRAVLHLPQAFLAMCLALLRIRKAGKVFVHTPHTGSATAVGVGE